MVTIKRSNSLTLKLSFASVNREEHLKNNYQIKYYSFLHSLFSRDILRGSVLGMNSLL